jgi:1-acyl-sn-glycerol-3-phosphate acyltransferase
MAETLAISVPTVMDAARGRLTRKACDERLSSWSKRVVEHLGMTVEVQGAEHFDPAMTYLVMSNHQSHYDVPVLFHVFSHVLGGQKSLRMVAKIELFSLPFFGRAMKEAGFIAIDRGSRDSAIDSLRQARETMESGINVWIAPEGTRSPDGELLPFKKGGFHLALDVREPILPVTIQGTRAALPRGASRSSRGADVRVTLHRAIDVAPYERNAKGIGALAEDVRGVIASRL